MKINLAVDLDIHAFSGVGISEYDTGMVNCMVHVSGKTGKVTQRPSIDISYDSNDNPALNDRGRGIYYWEQNLKLYIIHDNDVYAASQNNAPIGMITAGTERVTMLETVGVPRLVILDPENNEGWVLSTAEILSQIGSNFPPDIVYGGAILDGYLFVMDDAGIIYNSAIDDPEDFPPLGFLKAERENDKGVYLGKHHDHIVAFGTRTIEFFYDSANQTGSPLNRRQDLSYNIGCADGLAVWENGDTTYFIGSNPSGQLAIYKLEQFQITPISNDSMNSYLTQGITQTGLNVTISGLSAMGNDTILMTIYTLSNDTVPKIQPQVTFSYDSKTGLWGLWDTTVNGHATFPVMAWTKRTGGQSDTLRARTGEGILYNGDIININDKLIPVDTLLSSAIYEAGIYENDIYTETASDVGVNIGGIIRTGLQDFGTNSFKFQNREIITAENTVNPQTLRIRHADESNVLFDAGNTVDMSIQRKQIVSGGRFTKRNYQLEFSTNEQLFLEDLDVDVEVGM